MTKKLLNSTLRIYLIFSVFVFVVTAPLFYIIIQKLYIEDADEVLLLRKKEFVYYSIPDIHLSDIAIWNKINRDIKIEATKTTVQTDTLFYSNIYDTLNNELELYRVLNSPISIEGRQYCFVSKISLVESYDLIQHIVLLFSVVLILLLAGLYLITKRLSLRLWKPFYHTVNQIEQFEIDKNSQVELTDTTIEEFKRLNNSITKLIERNTIIYNSQREFIENAAHELQTPLAVFQAQIDTLIQNPDITEEQFGILNKLNDSAARLNKLNKNLLLLSKIDNNQFALSQQIVLNDIINKQIDFFKEQAAAKNISIKVELSDKTIINSNPVLAEILISNLFLNAIRHNIIGGNITVNLSNKLLTFYNTGNQQPLNKDRLFKRFSKINPSSEGNGLGLAIIKKITDINHWSIQYSYQNNLHIFEVNF